MERLKIKIKLLARDGNSVLVTAIIPVADNRADSLPLAVIMADRCFMLVSTLPLPGEDRIEYREVLAVALPNTKDIHGTPGTEIEGWTENLLRY